MTPQTAIQRVLDGNHLAEAEMSAVMETVLRGDATPAQVAALLVGLRQKGEHVDELVGAARVLRAHAVSIPDVPGNAIDTCGTGGDGARTFNVSTAAALVVAATGVPVAKHGNRAVSGSTGSADVLEVLGVVVEQAPAVLGDCLRGVGIAFLYAPALHPLLARVSTVRRELGVRTVFNLLGPLVNPAGVRRQVVGVGEARLVEPVARVLAALGHERAWVVHGAGGLDELGLEGPSTVADVRAGTVRTFTVDAREAGLQAAPNAALCVGSGAESAARVQAVLAGEAGPGRDVVCLNAAAALVVAGAAADLGDGVRRAQDALDSGAAAAVLDRLVRFTRRERAAEAAG
jgi:anthranilate phosphoribosyltransferase